MRFIFFVILLQLLTFVVGAIPNKYRLPRGISVSKYEIEITPYFEDIGSNAAFTFDGKVVITLSTTWTNVSAIILHASNLDVKSLVLQNGDTTIPTNPFGHEVDTDKLIIRLDENLEENVNYTLTMQYIGKLEDNLRGFYRSSYIEESGKKWLGTTQFQPSDARSAFPCFDEPGFKSVFQVTINRPKSFSISLANTRLKESKDHETLHNYVTEKYEDTPKMSTYLVAFIISNFTGRENNDKTFGVYARPDMYKQTEYAFNVGEQILKKMSEYLDSDYYENGMKKMHLVGMPDRGTGGMENWGLLTFHEEYLLYDEAATPSRAHQRIATTISHEIAHMWFGNLLTCQWWAHIWLNEGFARYFTYFGTNMVEKDWDLEFQFAVEQVQDILYFDSTESTHPLSMGVSSPEEVSQIFDGISYGKGAVFLRMLRLIVGDAKFQQILRTYIAKNKFGNVVPEDFFDAFETAVDSKNYTEFMKLFTYTAGYPLITATYRDKTLSIAQKRFLVKSMDHNDKTLYHVPITYASNGSKYDSTVPVFYLTELEANIQLKEAPKDYIILNVQQAFFYRVNYDEENWRKIGMALRNENHDGIHVLNRAQIIDDLFNLARAGVVKYQLVLEVVEYLKNETHYIPWLSALMALDWVASRMSGGDDLELFSYYIKDLSEDVYRHLMYNSIFQRDRRTDIYTRVNILTWLCKFGHEDCLKHTKIQFTDYLRNKALAPNADYRVLIYCNGVRQGGEVEFKFLKDRYNETLLQVERSNILQRLACTKDQKLMDEYLDFIISDAVRLQDRDGAFTNAYTSNPQSYKMVFKYIVANFKKWGTKMDLNTISSVADRFTTEKEIDELKVFVDSIKSMLSEPQLNFLNQIVQKAENNLKWDERNLKDIREYIRAMKSGASILRTWGISTIILLATLIHY